MNKLSLFVRVFWKSMFSPVYYHDVVKAKFSFSLKYFLFFSFVLGLILTLSLTTVILPPLSKFSGRPAPPDSTRQTLSSLSNKDNFRLTKSSLCISPFLMNFLLILRRPFLTRSNFTSSRSIPKPVLKIMPKVSRWFL